ncbi:DUF2252 domain-containing protein [Dankookia rubra]|uniref:DUF2252 domain-containing protein n=1 Tax=Dankookia rubra TaxID=1442381 RepID=A0A4V3AB10_9PROT|nr:DUF2252 family protein [Dankookia rubra]TDH63925.1 DUF2252 domain-containing protein [Dankookia rubra]
MPGPDIIDALDAWLGRQCGVIPAALARKRALMAADPSAFLRGTAFRFAAQFAALLPKLATTFPVAVRGDPHLADFRTWRDAEDPPASRWFGASTTRMRRPPCPSPPTSSDWRQAPWWPAPTTPPKISRHRRMVRRQGGARGQIAGRLRLPAGRHSRSCLALSGGLRQRTRPHTGPWFRLQPGLVIRSLAPDSRKLDAPGGDASALLTLLDALGGEIGHLHASTAAGGGAVLGTCETS